MEDLFQMIAEKFSSKDAEEIEIYIACGCTVDDAIQRVLERE